VLRERLRERAGQDYVAVAVLIAEDRAVAFDLAGNAVR
jgi:hypothetical protein